AQAPEDGASGDDPVAQPAERLAGDAAGVLRARVELGPHGVARVHLGVLDAGCGGRAGAWGEGTESRHRGALWALARYQGGRRALSSRRPPHAAGPAIARLLPEYADSWYHRLARREARISWEPQRRRAPELRRRLVGAGGPEPRLRFCARQGHDDRRRAAGEPVPPVVGRARPEDARQRPLLRGHCTAGHRVGWFLAFR